MKITFLDFLAIEAGTDRSCLYEITTLRCVMPQQSADLIYPVLFLQVSCASLVMTFPDIAAEPCGMWVQPGQSKFNS